MKLQKRKCDILFEATCPMDGWQSFDFVICGDKHQFQASGAVSCLMGDLLNVLCDMYIETKDCCDCDRAKAVCDNQLMPFRITGMEATMSWDDEGNGLYWYFYRKIDDKNNMLTIKLNYDSKKEFRYEVPYFEFCYAVAKAATKVIKQTGFIGFHYSAEHGGGVDIRHLLQVKHLGIFKKPYPLILDSEYEGKELLKDEIELLMFDM